LDGKVGEPTETSNSTSNGEEKPADGKMEDDKVAEVKTVDDKMVDDKDQFVDCESGEAKAESDAVIQNDVKSGVPDVVISSLAEDDVPPEVISADTNSSTTKPESEPVISEPVNSEPATSETVNSEPATSKTVNSDHVNSEPVNSDIVNSDSVHSVNSANKERDPSVKSPRSPIIEGCEDDGKKVTPKCKELAGGENGSVKNGSCLNKQMEEMSVTSAEKEEQPTIAATAKKTCSPS